MIPLRQVRGSMGIRCITALGRNSRSTAFPQGLVSRTLDETDLDADYILGMDASNVRNIHAFVDGKSDATVARLLEVAGVSRDIADPWYTGDFKTTFNDVTKGCTALLDKIKKDNL